MSVSLNINDVLSQVKRLNKDEQFILLQRIAALLGREKANIEDAPTLKELSGLGSEIWKSVEDIDNYIDAERQW